MTVHARVLGVAQDAGVPQAGCACPRCERFRAAPLLPACLGLVGASGDAYLIDATPAFGPQVAMLPSFPRAIALTHLHMGHYAGLLQLGPEACHRRVAVHATPAACAFLAQNQPWASLDLDLRELTAAPVELEPGLALEPVPVPHRAEHSDTVAYLVRGPRRTLLYLPDIDAWEIDLSALLARCDLALLDGTFHARGELPRQGEVPHPPIAETLDLLSPGEAAKVRFLHFNHTNPVLDRDGPAVLAAVQGERIALG